MKVLMDSLRILLVIILFILPFYSGGLFWGVEYGEYYGMAFSSFLLLLLVSFSHTYIPHFFKARKNLKTGMIVDMIDNLSFIKGMKQVKVLEISDSFRGICFFKSWTGDIYMLINSAALNNLNKYELKTLLSLHLEILKSSTSLRCLGGILIFIMGIPLRKLSSFKSVALLFHFFFIPLHALSRSLFSLNNLRFKAVNDNFNPSEIVLINSSLEKLERAETRNFDIFSEQIIEVFSLTKPVGHSAFDILIKRQKVEKNFFELKMES